MLCIVSLLCFFFFTQKTAYEMRISDWSTDVCSSDLRVGLGDAGQILIVDHDQFGGVARLLVGFGDDEGDGIADEADALGLEHLAAGVEHLGAAGAEIGRASCRERGCQYG